MRQASHRQQAENLDATTDTRSLRPSHGWGGTIAPDGIAPEGVPNCNCTSMLSAGPRRRPGSCAYASLGPPQWTWRSLAALRNKFSACLVLPVRRKLDFTEQQSFLAIGAARHIARPLATSRRPGRSRNTTTPASSLAATTAKRLRTSISRRSQGDEQRRTC